MRAGMQMLRCDHNLASPFLRALGRVRCYGERGTHGFSQLIGDVDGTAKLAMAISGALKLRAQESNDLMRDALVVSACARYLNTNLCHLQRPGNPRMRPCLDTY